MVVQGFQFEPTCVTPGSATPTPPSSPGSQRSCLSQKDTPSTPVQNSSPITTPKIRRGSYSWRANISRGSSTESLDDEQVVPNVKIDLHSPLICENLQKHDRLSLNPQQNVSTEDTKYYEALQAGLVCDKPRHVKAISPQGQGQNDGELHSKCEMWLQTLNISQGDKIKSRSHIQLPPLWGLGSKILQPPVICQNRDVMCTSYMCARTVYDFFCSKLQKQWYLWIYKEF